MKSTSLALLPLLLVAPLSCHAAERLIPAGSLVQCTVSEPKLSSKTTAAGDPVLCQVGYSERYGRSVLPYDSYMVGRFEDYKDPGHFVGKGWMELKFDRMVIEPDTVIPVSARVVGAPGYNVDRQGRILGKGHAVRDTVEWMIPILWPIDLLNLPRRGPRPTLKEETRLTLKVMDDLAVPVAEPQQQDPSGLIRRAPSAYTPPPPDAGPPPSPVYYPLTAAPPPPVYWFAPPPPRPTTVHRMPYPGPNVPNNREPVTLIFNNGYPPERIYNYVLTPNAIYVLDGYRHTIPLDAIDLATTARVNQAAGADFRLPGYYGR